MKTVITSKGDSFDSPLDPRFGRCAWFCLYDEQTGEAEFMKNDSVDVAGGAGTRTAEKMIEWNVKKVISGDYGPKAKDLLDRFNVQLVIMKNEDKTVGEIVGKLKERSGD